MYQLQELRPTLETDRLILRPPAAEDLNGWVAFTGDDETMRFIGGVQTRAGAWRALMTTVGSWALNGFGLFAVIEKRTGRWIGRIGPWRPEGWPGTEIGWGLLRSATGQGLAFEGTCAAIDWAVDALGWTDIIHIIDPANAASIKLAEKLGATHRGPCRLPPPLDTSVAHVWGQTAAEWRSPSRATASNLRPAR